LKIINFWSIHRKKIQSNDKGLKYYSPDTPQKTVGFRNRKKYIPDPGSRGRKSIGSRIRNTDFDFVKVVHLTLRRMSFLYSMAESRASTLSSSSIMARSWSGGRKESSSSRSSSACRCLPATTFFFYMRAL
jgi:hypothetical protein